MIGLHPSMMCADHGHLARETRELDLAGADSLHIDVMDGSFVPNFAMGLEDVRAVRAATRKPLDVHLMVENPARTVQLYADAGADVIYLHPEAERYTVKTLAAIRAAGCKAGIAVNPDTSIATVEEMLNLCDYVMVMTVNPGFAGQAFIEFTIPKIERLAAHKAAYGYQIVIDGACSPARIRELSALGADAFVLGTSALFGKGDYAESFSRLRALDIAPATQTAA